MLECWDVPPRLTSQHPNFPTGRAGGRTLLLLLHRAAEGQRHRALPFRRGFGALFRELREFIALERRLRGFVTQRHPLALRIDAHHAHEKFLARLKSLGWIRARRDGDFGIRNESRESRLELHEDSGSAAVINSGVDDFSDRITL